MIVLEGPNLALRDALQEELQRRLSGLTLHRSGQRPDDLRALCRQLWSDNRLELRVGFPLDLPHGHGARHMVASAIAATGSMFVVCCEEWDDLHLMRDKYLPASHYVSSAILNGKADVAETAGWIANVWQQAVSYANQTFEFCSSGTNQGEPVMVVGERVNPYRPIEVERRLPFTSHDGCSLFLHRALLATDRPYYLTNALKTTHARTNRQLLHQEIVRVCPSRIVAMGQEAARVLADLRVSYEITYHPQYWKRFKNQDFGELVKLLGSTKTPPHVYEHRKF